MADRNREPAPLSQFNASGNSHSTNRRLKDAAFGAVCGAAASAAVVLLAALLIKIVLDGSKRLSWEFLTDFPRVISNPPGGILPALVGSFYVVILTAGFTIPVGVAAAVYLEEFVARKNKITEFIEVNISNLSGVPSIVYGMLGLGIFIGILNMKGGVLVGALTMSLLILPMVILVSREALKAVPSSYREGSLALGCTQGRMIWSMVLPNALPGILTGIILSIGRAIGETAPLIVVGSAVLVTKIPQNINDDYTVLPIQIFNWSRQPREEFPQGAASAIVVLMAVLLVLNSVAIIIRARAQKKQRA